MFDPKKEPPSTWSMSKLFLQISVPAILTNLIMFTASMTNAIFAGHMNDPIKLAVVGLSNSTCAIMVHSILIGQIAPIDTLASQAFGAGNLDICGIMLNRGRVIVTMLFIFFAAWPVFFGE